MVVFPFVPVTPTSFSLSVGLSYHSEARNPSAEAQHSTFIYVTSLSSTSGSVWHTTAVAPAFTTSGMNLCPSTVTPGTATNKAPGVIFRESLSMLEISLSVAPVMLTALILDNN